MKIEFRSNEKNTGSGFRAKWALNCGGNFTANFKEQFIRSPGYPDKYKDNLDCWYNITALGKHIIIRFEHFELEVGSPNCPYDSLTISYSLYGSLKTKTYCGSTKPPDITVKDAVSIRFKTDLFVRKPGFLFSYTTDECGYDITSPTTVSSPDYTAGSPETLAKLYKCTWNITAPGNKVVAIKFDKLYTEDSRYCWYNYVALYNGHNSSQEAKLATLCGNLTSVAPIIKSTKNKMTLTYRSYNSKVNVFSASIYFTYGNSYFLLS
ncbi:CUB domain-containing protein [Oryctes borbonicus]|uniref:CUB domain-containing protein n=1 Tax=Oryctes borbonicus TaxID=1629725 RepID=A0A0T6AZR0_9SCAR|nr:CUB domain-containing protein [Oryctes borbonicus]